MRHVYALEESKVLKIAHVLKKSFLDPSSIARTSPHRACGEYNVLCFHDFDLNCYLNIRAYKRRGFQIFHVKYSLKNIFVLFLHEYNICIAAIFVNIFFVILQKVFFMIQQFVLWNVILELAQLSFRQQSFLKLLAMHMAYARGGFQGSKPPL